MTYNFQINTAAKLPKIERFKLHHQKDLSKYPQSDTQLDLNLPISFFTVILIFKNPYLLKNLQLIGLFKLAPISMKKSAISKKRTLNIPTEKSLKAAPCALHIDSSSNRVHENKASKR